MNVSDQFLEIDIFFNDNGLITILKQVPMSFMATVIAAGIARQKLAHKCSNTLKFRDLHTVTQQVQGRKMNIQSVGSFLLGNAPDMSVI